MKNNTDRTFQGSPEHPISGSERMSDKECSIGEMIVKGVESCDDLGNRGCRWKGLGQSEEGRRLEAVSSPFKLWIETDIRAVVGQASSFRECQNYVHLGSDL